MDRKAQSQSQQCDASVSQDIVKQTSENVVDQTLIDISPKINHFFLKREFYLLFSNATCWWKTFLKKGFGHIDILCHDEFNWMYLNISQKTLIMTILPALGKTPIQKVLKDFNSIFKKPTVLKIVTQFPIPSKQLIFPRMGVNTCTQLVKYLIGIKMFTWTPYHFYKKLLKISKPTPQILSVEKVGD